MNENNIFKIYIEVESIIENNIFYLFEFYHIGYIYKIYIDKKRCHVFVYATAEAQEIIHQIT